MSTTASFDPESADWIDALTGSGRKREHAVVHLHSLLLRASRSELARRADRLRLVGPEVDDLANQAADDALLAILGKLSQFRGDSLFTTWVYKFAVFEVSTKLARHFWRTTGVPMHDEDWERLPDRFGLDPCDQAEAHELVSVLRAAVDAELSRYQRRVFIAIVVNAVPLDTLVVELGSTRNAIYKTMFDARRKLRAALVANGFLDNPAARPTANRAVMTAKAC